MLPQADTHVAEVQPALYAQAYRGWDSASPRVTT